MQRILKKTKNQQGFTLVELLLVVAIIAVLVAVSIPMISNSLEKARHSTDEANERAAKAEILVQYMAGEDGKVYASATDATVSKVENDVNYFYDAASGKILKAAPTKTYGQHKNHTYLQLSVDVNGMVTMRWVGGDSALCSDAASYTH